DLLDRWCRKVHLCPHSYLVHLFSDSSFVNICCWGRKAGLLITPGKVTVLSEVVSKRSLLCTIACMLHYRDVLPLCLARTDHLTSDTHCFNLTQEDHMIPTRILCYHLGINKGEGVVNDRRSCCRNMITGMAETFIALR